MGVGRGSRLLPIRLYDPPGDPASGRSLPTDHGVTCVSCGSTPCVASMRERNALRQGLLLLAHLSLSSALSMSSSSSRSSSASSNQGWIGDAAGAGPTPALSLLSPNQRALAAMPHFPRTWVPLASTYELDGMRPNRVEFLGQSYVCYQNDPDDSSSWTVADDACPHRLAPLSEGRIIHADRDAHEVKPKERNEHKGEVTRLVECAYHGWAFDRNGRCVRIPQVTEQVQQRNIETNPKCHVHSYSTIVHKNLLFAWLWPEDSLQYTDMDPANQEHAWRRPEYMLSNLGNDTTTYTRDLPYGWDTLLENIVDPAHVPWVRQPCGQGLRRVQHYGSADTVRTIHFFLPFTGTPWLARVAPRRHCH